MKRLITLVVLFVVPAMAFAAKATKTSATEIRGSNREGLNQLSLGMSQEEVLRIMGTETYSVRVEMPFSTRRNISNPYRTEILVSKDAETLEMTNP